MYITPTNLSASRDPKRSPGGPANKAPRKVPTRPLATTKPSWKLPSVTWKRSRIEAVTPAMTTVSKPNNNPARLAVTMTPRFFDCGILLFLGRDQRLGAHRRARGRRRVDRWLID